MPFAPEIVARFLSKIEVLQDGCWAFRGAPVGPTGYRVFCVTKRDHWYAHRFSFTYYSGPIPEGVFVCHKCDNPPCVNPAHLFLGTHADNMRDMVSKGRQQRGEGHALSLLTEDAVRALHEAYASGEPRNEVAKRFGIAPGQVSKIARGDAWAHLGLPRITGRTKAVKKGGELPQARVTADDVLAIRARHAGGETTVSLAKAFGLTRPAVSLIVNRKNWKHI